jgi:hypothetical protein
MSSPGAAIVGPLTLVRVTGAANVIGGLLVAVFFIIHPGGQEPGTAATVLSTPYSAIHTLAVVGYIAIALGLVGAYAYQADRAGFLGVAGFIVGFAGSALLVGTFMHDGYEIPYLATIVHGSLEPGLAMNVAIGIAGVLFIAGFVAFGIATIYAGVFPRWSGVLLIIGAIVADLPPPPDTNLLRILTGHPGTLPWAFIALGAALLGIGIISLGYTMLRRPQR